MLVTLSWVVLLSAIAVLFMNSWLKLGKKVVRPFGVKMTVPVIIASVLVLLYEPWIDWALRWAHWGAQFSLNWLTPKSIAFWGQSIFIKTFIVTLVSLLPTVFAKVTEKPFRPFRPPYWTSFYIWLILMIFVVIPYE